MSTKFERLGECANEVRRDRNVEWDWPRPLDKGYSGFVLMSFDEQSVTGFARFEQLCWALQRDVLADLADRNDAAVYAVVFSAKLTRAIARKPNVWGDDAVLVVQRQPGVAGIGIGVHAPGSREIFSL